MGKEAFKYLVPIYIVLAILLFLCTMASAILMAAYETDVAIVLFMLCYIAMFPMMFLGYAFWVYMVVDCALRKFKNKTHKIVWIIVLCVFSYLAAFIYYYVEGKKKLK